MALYLRRIPSLIGEIRVYANDRAVVGLLMADEVYKGRDREFKPIDKGDNEVLIKAEEELKAFFSGNLKKFTVPVEVSGTDFQKAVWKALQTIDYGQLRTYADVARSITHPKAVRAVGRATGSNPVPIIIPCHRVVGSDTSLTGFGGGLATKQILLEIEGHTITNLKISNGPAVEKMLR
ncbi:MAG: methylated-DNA--[protein]-cysteine S-methyltransferase [Deltaproteobacteria bacterium]|nr:methylated-DNA--[protein]-cysteine S-methyltransferase [Deltaproteobacteria bacterium]